MIVRITILSSLLLFAHIDNLVQTPNQHQRKRVHELERFTNVDLGIQFDYDANSFDNEPDGLTGSNDWQWYKNTTLGIEFRLPPGYFVRVDKQDESRSWATPACDFCPYKDSCLVILFKDTENNLIRSVSIYFTSADFRHIAWDEHFIPVVKDLDIPIDIKYTDTLLIQSALSANYWESMGTEGMRIPASYLNGKVWKGLRGDNIIRIYNYRGNAGDDWEHIGFLTHNIAANCSVVFSYGNTPSSRTPLKEYRFYEIVSSVQFIK
jgi:hypothetical protein